MSQDEPKELKKRLLRLLEKEALKRGKFVLSSGRESNYYLDGRVITLTPEGAYLVGMIILDMLRSALPKAIGGPTIGADPIVGALAVLAHIHNVPVKTFIVRKAAKEHGTQKLVEGPVLNSGDEVVLVDDVATTGKAIIDSKQVLDKMGIIVRRAVVIVDRLEGAKDNLARAGVKLEPILTIKDFGL
jgi:orotate phosphoribosyltransferase